VKYNLNLIGIPRTPDEPGRGGSLNASFRWDKTDQQAEPGLAGVLSEDENWERIDYFLERVVPVAASNRVRLACHPHDPYTPPGYRGVTRVLGTVEGLKKFVLMRENPYHGLNFCQGSIGEMLENPGKEIDDVIRWFGQRGKIFNVHFRNIRGGKLSFMETFPEEGDMDMVRSARIYKEVGFKYMLMPDHVPTVSGKDPTATAFAFCYGYIAALLQVLDSE
jgi:mannonate dehydratase